MKTRKRQPSVSVAIRSPEENDYRTLMVIPEQGAAFAEKNLVEWDVEERCYYCKVPYEEVVKALEESMKEK